MFVIRVHSKLDNINKALSFRSPLNGVIFKPLSGCNEKLEGISSIIIVVLRSLLIRLRSLIVVLFYTNKCS